MADDFRSNLEAAAMQPAAESTASTTLPADTATDQLAAEPQVPAHIAEPGPEPQDTARDTPQPGTPEGDDLRSILEAQKAAHPEHAEVIDAIHREFQRGLTPKLQEAAELRKRMEQLGEVDPSDVQFLRQVNELALVSPQAAAQLLEQAKANLLARYGQAAPPPAVPSLEPEGMEWASEGERYLYQQQQQILAWQQQQQIERNQAVMREQHEALGREYGRAIPQTEWETAARWCLDNRLPPQQIGVVWKGLYGANLARQAGRDEGAQVGAQKAALGNRPSSIAPPAASPAPEPRNVREAVAWLGYGIRDE